MPNMPIFFTSVVVASTLSAVGGYFAAQHITSGQSSSTNIGGSTTIGTIKGTPISRASLTPSENLRLFEAETQTYNAVARIVEERYLDAFFENYKTSKNLPTKNAAQEAYFHENSAIPDSRVNEIVNQFASDDRLKNLSDEEKKKEVRRALEMQESQTALRSLVLQARRKGDILVAMPEPIEPALDITDAGNPAVGPQNAKVTIIEFADYECPFCARVVPTLWEVTKKYEGKVRWVFRDFPLPNHKNSVPAAIAANCAGAQGKYFEAHNFLFENHSKLGEDIYANLVSTLKLDSAAFKSCRENADQRKEVDTDLAAGERAGVNGTPTFFINGKRMKPGATTEAFSEAIEAELAK